jgi:hypothetical protein
MTLLAVQEDLHKAHATFHQPAGQQAAFPIIGGLRIIEAV